MTYSLPALVLVGAAQNLVLGPSFAPKPVCAGLEPDDDLGGPNIYNVEAAW